MKRRSQVRTPEIHKKNKLALHTSKTELILDVSGTMPYHLLYNQKSPTQDTPLYTVDMSNVETILKAVFSTDPAKLRDTYVRSSAFEERYTLLNSGHLRTMASTPSPNLKRWYGDLSALGVYERNFLHEVLESYNAIIAYRSGTGSGKSSLVSAVSEATNDFCKSKQWKATFSVKNFISVIDFQRPGRLGLEETGSSEDSIISNTDRLNDELYKLLSDKLSEQLQILTTPKSLRQLLIALDEDRAFSNQVSVTRLTSYLRDKFPENPTALRNRFRAFVHDEKISNYDKFSSLYHVFAYIGACHGLDRTKGKHTKDFVLIIDNSDKLHHVALTSLINIIKEMRADTLNYAHNFKVVFFLRLSTARDQIGALTEMDYRSFCSPAPTEIVLSRSIDFIFNDTALKRKFQKKDILDARYRVVELILELLDERIHDFAIALDAISGTNIRIAFEHVVKWCSADALRRRRGGETEFKTLKLSLTNAFVANEIISLYDRFNNYINDIFDDYHGRESLPTKKKILSNLSQIYRENFAIPDGEDNDLNARMQAIMLAELVRYRERMENICEQSSRHIRLNKSNERIRTTLHFDNPQKQEILEGIISNCEISLTRGIERNIDGGAILRAKQAIIATYLSHLRRLFSTEPAVTKITGRFYDSNTEEFVLPARIKEQNRFQRTSLLFNLERSGSESDTLPINLISLDSSRISDLSLRILYYLCERQMSSTDAGRGVQYEFLRQAAFDHGFVLDDIRKSMEQLTELNRRLIYSRVADHYYFNSDQWERMYENKRFYVSWAGYKYFEILLGNPTYVQWMMDNTREIVIDYRYSRISSSSEFKTEDIEDKILAPHDRRLKFIEHMENVSSGYRSIYTSEKSRMNQLDQRALRISAAACLSPIGDLVYRSARPIVRIMGAYTQNADHINRDDLNSLEHTRFQIVKTLKNLQDLCFDIHGQRNVNWRRTVSYVETYNLRRQ